MLYLSWSNKSRHVCLNFDKLNKLIRHTCRKLVTAFHFTIFFSAKISCIKCSSANDTNCARAKLEPTECAQEDDQCFFRIFNDNLIRGCYADLNAIEQASCDSNGGMCVKCQQSGCNNAYWPRCHTCVENADVGCEDEQSDSSKASFCSVFKSDNYCFASLNNDIGNRRLNRFY